MRGGPGVGCGQREGLHVHVHAPVPVEAFPADTGEGVQWDLRQPMGGEGDRSWMEKLDWPLPTSVPHKHMWFMGETVKRLHPPP